MKTVKIIIAFLIAVGVGFGYHKATSNLDHQAKALEKNVVVQAAPAIHTVKPEVKKTSSIESNTITPKPFNRDIASHIIAQFMAPFTMGDENGKIEGYSSLGELVQNYYKDFAGEGISSSFTSTFFYEKNGSVYILPTDSVKFYDDALPAEIVKITETHYQVKQKQKEGTISNIDFEFFGNENRWKLTGITFE